MNVASVELVLTQKMISTNILHSNANFQEEPWDPSLTNKHVAISPIRNSDLIDISDHGDLDISCTVDVSTEKPKFSCTICDFSSKFKQNLQRHLKGHKFEIKIRFQG